MGECGASGCRTDATALRKGKGVQGGAGRGVERLEARGGADIKWPYT